MVYKDQIPWFATSNGVIDLKTSADFRDNRYTNNEIVNNNNDDNKSKKNDMEESSKGSAKSQSKMMTKVMPGGLPPLAHDKAQFDFKRHLKRTWNQLYFLQNLIGVKSTRKLFDWSDLVLSTFALRVMLKEI